MYTYNLTNTKLHFLCIKNINIRISKLFKLEANYFLKKIKYEQLITAYNTDNLTLYTTGS
ncbi:MAG: hypothetical protein CVU00_12325 [Bacteroidetes bacterium HGW-Bacteroidetes-17]|nr:MAG: hypothetical protein CVU00_12325 [Bacteroidetes bacterium HGW-Bacteroidetes-17]